MDLNSRYPLIILQSGAMVKTDLDHPTQTSIRLLRWISPHLEYQSRSHRHRKLAQRFHPHRQVPLTNTNRLRWNRQISPHMGLHRRPHRRIRNIETQTRTHRPQILDRQPRSPCTIISHPHSISRPHRRTLVLQEK